MLCSCVQGCPSVCECTGTVADCQLKGLTSVPNGFSTDTTEIKLNYNYITSIDDSSFNGLTKLTNVEIFSNQISSISKDAFSTLPELSVISLKNNEIENLPDGLFTRNPLLREIRLHGNNIKTLNPSVFSPTTNIIVLQLNDNPLVCCNMTSFIEWILNQSELTPISVVCELDTDPIDLHTFLCPVDGQWGVWSESPCSVSCGTGNITRTRYCNNPAPSNGGNECSGMNTEVIQCNTSCSTDKGLDDDFDWMPIVIGVVIGVCLLAGVIFLITLICVKHGSTKKVSCTNDSPLPDQKIVRWS